MHILVIENNDAHRYALTKILESAGHAVTAGAFAGDCVHLATEHQPDVILLDIQLPDGSGIDVCRELNRTAQTANMPVILYTSSDVSSDVHDSGAYAVLTYPVHRKDLLVIIDAVAARAKLKWRT